MMGKGSYIARGEIPNNVTVGNYSSIGIDCIFHTNGRNNHLCIDNRECVYTTNYRKTETAEPIVIGHDVWIADGVRVMEGVHIGNGVIIGAGAVIGKDVPPFAVVVGNPQVIKRYRFTPEQIEALERIKWWEWDKPLVMERLDDMQNITNFIQKYG